MERIPIRITALLAMTTLAACDFLDIDTPGIVNRDKMFENEQGFIDAMNGVYASMADADLYGEQLSFGFVDEIAQLYYNDYEANETTLTKTFDLRYRDEDVRPQIDAIWSKAYNTIASANSVLDNISGHDFAILPRIRGEALTVRAFLHFDLLRLFAPNIERGDEQAIPYVEHFSISPVERSTVREVYERIVADLTEAYGLLRDAQPASGRTPEELYVSQYAAAALLARVCNWGGDHETAERYALEALKGPFAFIREEQTRTSFWVIRLARSASGDCTLPTCISTSAAGSTPRGSPTNSTWYATTTRRSSACRRSRRPTTTTVTRAISPAPNGSTRWCCSPSSTTNTTTRSRSSLRGASRGRIWYVCPSCTTFWPNRSTTAIRPLRSNI